MKIAKKQKQKKRKPQKSRLELVDSANKFNLALCIRTLKAEGWGSKRIGRFIEGYCSLLEEVADGRNTSNKFVRETKELTGYDVIKIIDSLNKCDGKWIEELR